MADVKFPILEADFLWHFGLVVDVRNRQLQDPASQAAVHGRPSRHPPLSPTLLAPLGDTRFTAILHEFSDLTRQPHADSAVTPEVRQHITI